MAIAIVLTGALGIFALARLLVITTRRLPRSRVALRPAASSDAGLSSRHSRVTRPPTVSVVVPTLNEAGCVGWVLEQLPPWVSEVVLVDGLSTDHTEVIARDLRAELVVVHQGRRGKGAALRAGFAAATGDIIVMIDADGSTNPAEMDRFVRALQDGADFVKGSRHLRNAGSADWTYLRRAGNRTFVRLVNLLYGCKFTDLCYGYCAFWRQEVDALSLTADGFEIETQLALNAVKAGLRIREVPSFELPRRAGTSNLKAFGDGLRVLRTIMNARPGRASQTSPQRPQIGLHRIELPSPGSEGWRPAGNDRRRSDRRGPVHFALGWTDPERRRLERRRQPQSTVTVFRANQAPEPLPRAPDQSAASSLPAPAMIELT